ncbi:hypothetical protein ILP92_06155 [Maribius pontilimi]|uniref:Uncharacterized protein n=1 Tax=Palleronia pontilimi TaxID=1964209 RepID=A0A934ID88_9RHOB|nr:hypothetical protein [Palleronia pontilimi]MBJ3762322.1 hypothetical protein [Palleronia pontilimi]
MNVLWDIALPVAGMAALGVAAPYLWARLLPEGVGGLVANFALSVVTCAAAAGLWRFGLSAPGWGAMLRWEAMTAIIWGPCVLLAVAQQPGRWKDVTW